MKKRSRESFSPDITPLIDVVFLLLIFFMVSTVFKKNELALLMTLPDATADQKTTEVTNNFYIEVNKESVAFNGKSTTIEELSPLLSTIKNKTSYIELRVDREVRYDRVIKVLDLLKNHHLQNLALITNPK